MKDHPPAYLATTPALSVDKAFYRRIAEAPGRKLVDRFTIPIRSGRAWKVPAGHVFRIVTVEGPQVGDLNIWNADNPRERLWASRTRQLQAAHVSVFDRLWSTLPYLRPLATITSGQPSALESHTSTPSAFDVAFPIPAASVTSMKRPPPAFR